jgi:hypothetical protein
MDCGMMHLKESSTKAAKSKKSDRICGAEGYKNLKRRK